MIKKLGVQVFSIKNSMQTFDDIKTSFYKLKELGYDQIQTAGCPIPAKEYGQIAAEAGLEICGTHYPLDKMRSDIKGTIKDHRLFNTTNIGIGGYFHYTTEESVHDLINTMNQIASEIYPYGFKFTYHNHSHEFKKINGKTIMDMLVEGLDPEKTSFVLDTYWVQYGGGDVRHWIEKLKGRIDILHLRDMAMIDKTPVNTEIGNGNLYFDGIIETAEKAGVQYYIVEQDCTGDPFTSLKISMDYIRSRYMG